MDKLKIDLAIFLTCLHGTNFPIQKGQMYPGNNFNYHLIPFESAIAAGTTAIMPYYGIPVGQTQEEVAMAFYKITLSHVSTAIKILK